MTEYSVGCSPLTHTIFADRANKNGTEWLAKSDVTTQALVAVAEHVTGRHGGAMTLRAPDGSGWNIEVIAVPAALVAELAAVRAERDALRAQNEVGICGEIHEWFKGCRPNVCELLSGHKGWHRDGGTQWEPRDTATAEEQR